MGGTIDANSVYGEGTEFIVKLPQKISKMEAPEVTEEEVEKVRDESIYVGKKLLVVDDNSLNLKVAERTLDGLNLDIEYCTSGKECLEKIKDGKVYDLILMDIVMPEMQGDEFLICL